MELAALPPDSLAGFKGPTSMGGEENEVNGKGKDERGREEMEEREDGRRREGMVGICRTNVELLLYAPV